VHPLGWPHRDGQSRLPGGPPVQVRVLSMRPAAGLPGGKCAATTPAVSFAHPSLLLLHMPHSSAFGSSKGGAAKMIAEMRA
jgi:hypothetical protein